MLAEIVDVTTTQDDHNVRVTKRELVEPHPFTDPIFSDRADGLPRSNYHFLDTPSGIRNMPQKAIDAILAKVNLHKGREPK